MEQLRVALEWNFLSGETLFDSRKKPLAFWGGEELGITFIGTAEMVDYAVSQSPSWTEIEELLILGVRAKLEALPQELLQKSHELSNELYWQSPQ